MWLLFGLAAAVGAGPTCQTADRRVETVIASKVKETGGAEYCESRLYHTLDDLDGDGRDDFMLVFTVEAAAGGNDSVDYLAVFPSGSRWRPSVVKVGERGERFIDDIEVEEDRTFVLVTSEYLRGDPMCCPSGEGELHYRLVHGRVVPVAGTPPDERMLTTAEPAGSGGVRVSARHVKRDSHRSP